MRNETRELVEAMQNLVFLGRRLDFIQWTVMSYRKICSRGVIQLDLCFRKIILES